ncbi:MAG: GNAT family N-acetyltransferase, partial [archaeon]|nr:GNAT family N-acetyltransferase [archaeon]
MARVKKRYHRHGVGEKLYREVEKRLEEAGIRMMIVDTEQGNVEALDFFKKMGFNTAREHIWMTKTLKLVLHSFSEYLPLTLYLA